MSQFKETIGTGSCELCGLLCGGNIRKRVHVPLVELSSQENRAKQERRHKGIHPLLPIDLEIFGENLKDSYHLPGSTYISGQQLMRHRNSTAERQKNLFPV